MSEQLELTKGGIAGKRQQLRNLLADRILLREEYVFWVNLAKMNDDDIADTMASVCEAEGRALNERIAAIARAILIMYG